MILRRISEHVKAQNWTAVALDFVIVVMGVFIGIQVSNWNAERQTKGLEANYLERLHADLLRSRVASQEDLTFALKGVEEATFILEALVECRLDAGARDRFAAGLYRLGKLSQSTLVDTTLDEMKATGNLSVLSDRALVQSLVELQRLIAEDAKAFRQVEAWTNDQVKEIHSRVIFNNVAPVTAASPIDWDHVTLDFDAACQDATLKAAVGSIRNYTIENARRSERILQRIDAVLEPLEAALAPGPASGEAN